jgi:hypothetical protein
VTPYLHHGDKVRLEMLDDRGQSIFGAIEQTVARRRVIEYLIRTIFIFIQE